mmetsp:Transcript_9935/g.41689  ORF Transcript_9935/g.41689 Transcript_9935/m.41689 type:complete len:285 (+) Transcript_9935:260-1114(+)
MRPAGQGAPLARACVANAPRVWHPPPPTRTRVMSSLVTECFWAASPRTPTPNPSPPRSADPASRATSSFTQAGASRSSRSPMSGRTSRRWTSSPAPICSRRFARRRRRLTVIRRRRRQKKKKKNARAAFPSTTRGARRSPCSARSRTPTAWRRICAATMRTRWAWKCSASPRRTSRRGRDGGSRNGWSCVVRRRMTRPPPKSSDACARIPRSPCTATFSRASTTCATRPSSRASPRPRARWSTSWRATEKRRETTAASKRDSRRFLHPSRAPTSSRRRRRRYRR